MRVLPAWSKACPATRWWQSTCRSACPNSPARAGADPRRWCGRCSASASRASFRSRRAPPSMPRRSRSRRSSSGTRRIGRRARRRAGHSQPPRAVSIQAFGIFPKIREIDALLRERADLRQRVIESHPEVAFWRLNGGQAMRLPKKVKGMVNPPGMAERRTLLRGLGLARRISRTDAAARRCRGRLPRRLRAAVHRSAPCARGSAAISRPARPGRPWHSDGDLGVMAAAGGMPTGIGQSSRLALQH